MRRILRGADWRVREAAGDLKGRNARTGETASAAKQAVLSLEQRYERLRQINMAMWALMKDRLGVTDADLIAYVETIQADAPASKLMKCPSCHRIILSNSAACISCGTKTTATGTFQTT